MKLLRPAGLTRTPKPRSSESQRKFSETLTPTFEGLRASTVRLLTYSMRFQCPGRFCFHLAIIGRLEAEWKHLRSGHGVESAAAGGIGQRDICAISVY